MYALQRVWTNRQAFVSLSTVLGKRRTEVVLPPMIPILVRLAHGLEVATACAAPLAYLSARLGRLRFFHGSNLSLSADPAVFVKQANETSSDGRQWRYRYDWIDQPERVGDIYDRVRKKMFYYFFLSGSVEEKMLQESSKSYSGLARESGVHILDRIRADKEKRPESWSTDRSMWKQRAMKIMADEHKENYARKRFDDPLGMALFLHYEIGLGLPFDDDRELSEGEELTTRRLQARAVKSAIRRSKELYGASKTINEITDHAEREQKRKEIRERTEKEIKRIAARLTELVPTDMDLDAPLALYAQVDPSFKQVSKHEYVRDGPRDLKDLGLGDEWKVSRRPTAGGPPASQLEEPLADLDTRGELDSRNAYAKKVSECNEPENALVLIIREQSSSATSKTTEENSELADVSQVGSSEKPSPTEVVNSYLSDELPSSTLNDQNGKDLGRDGAVPSDDEFIEAWMRQRASPSNDDDDIALC